MSVGVITLETPRLRLRPLADADLDGYAAMCSDPEVMRFLGGETLSREDAWRQMAMLAGHWQLRGYGMWALEEKATGRFAGRVGPHFPEGWPGREVGWALARPFWGRGYAFEAARASIDFAFARLGWERVISLIHSDNARSIRLAERLGERFAGTVTVRGVEARVYELPAGEWPRAAGREAAPRGAGPPPGDGPR
jgi:RimJ/RimL family protein N-acetyltransferase